MITCCSADSAFTYFSGRIISVLPRRVKLNVLDLSPLAPRRNQNGWRRRACFHLVESLDKALPGLLRTDVDAAFGRHSQRVYRHLTPPNDVSLVINNFRRDRGLAQ